VRRIAGGRAMAAEKGMRSSTINFVGGRVQSVHLHRPLRIQRQQFHRAPILQATPQQVKSPSASSSSRSAAGVL
jgi:hypothetical protein